MFKKNLTNKIDFVNLFLILSYIACWLSISTSGIDIIRLFDMYALNKSSSDNGFLKIYPDRNEIVNFARQLIILIIFPILLFLNCIYFKKFKFNYNLGFLAFFIYFLLQIPGLLLTKNPYYNFGFILSALNIILILNLSSSLFNEKKFQIYLYLSLFFLVLITYVNRGVYINFFNYDTANYLYLYFDLHSSNFLDKASPRSTGSARTLLIIYILSLILFNKFFERHKIIRITFYLIVATIILFFQSRTVTVLLLVFLFFNFLFENKINLKNLTKYLIVYTLVPIAMLYGFVSIKNSETIDKYIELKYQNIAEDQMPGTLSIKLQAINKNFNRPIDETTFSSGRVMDWNELLGKFTDSIVFGYGSQGDRFLINQSASSGLIYALTSSGVTGITFYIFFLLSCLIKISKILIFKQSQFSKKIKLTSIIMLILLLRSILESSFAVFGVDFIIMSTFYIYLTKYELEKENVY